MAFGKKKKDRSAPATESASTPAPRRRRDEHLASVVPETTTSAAIDLMRTADRFALPGGTAWAVPLLAASDIGGLSKKDNRDPDKGSIIEDISGDRIATVATPDMLEAEIFGIIPTTDTLATVSEYILLTGASYTWAVVTARPGGGLSLDTGATARTTGFKDIAAIAGGNAVLADALGSELWSHYAVTQTPGQSSEAPVETDVLDSEPTDTVSDTTSESSDATAVNPIVPDFDEGGPASPDSPDFEGESAGTGDAVEPDEELEPDLDDVYDEPYDTELLDDGEDADWVSVDDEDDQTMSAEEFENAPLDADGATVNSTVVRRFAPDDLDLELDVAGFRTAYSIGSPSVEIAVPDDVSGWLGDQIAVLVRQANAELAELHTSGEAGLQALYTELMSTHIDHVVADVSLTDDDGAYKPIAEAILADRDKRNAAKEEVIVARRDRIVADFEAAAKKFAADAATEAEARYRSRHDADLRRDQAEAAAEIDASIETTYHRARAAMLEARRRDAFTRLERGQTRIFEIIGEHQADQLSREQAALHDWTARIDKLVADHRADDIDRTKALEREQATVNKIADLKTEQEATLAAIRADADHRIAEVNAELDRAHAEAETRLAAHESEWNHNLELERARTASADSRADNLKAQIGDLEESYRRRDEEHTAEVERTRAAAHEEAVHSHELQTRATRVLTSLIIALSLFFGMAGFIVGSVW
jgi:hypothetical protein